MASFLWLRIDHFTILNNICSTNEYIKKRAAININSYYSRILYEVVLSYVRSGVCTIATNSDEDIIGVCLNRIEEGKSSKPLSWTELLNKVKETSVAEG